MSILRREFTKSRCIVPDGTPPARPRLDQPGAAVMVRRQEGPDDCKRADILLPWVEEQQGAKTGARRSSALAENTGNRRQGIRSRCLVERSVGGAHPTRGDQSRRFGIRLWPQSFPR